MCAAGQYLVKLYHWLVVLVLYSARTDVLTLSQISVVREARFQCLFNSIHFFHLVIPAVNVNRAAPGRFSSCCPFGVRPRSDGRLTALEDEDGSTGAMRPREGFVQQPWADTDGGAMVLGICPASTPSYDRNDARCASPPTLPLLAYAAAGGYRYEYGRMPGYAVLVPEGYSYL